MTFSGVFYCPTCEKTYQIDLEKGVSSVEYAKNNKCEVCDGILQAVSDENRL